MRYESTMANSHHSFGSSFVKDDHQQGQQRKQLPYMGQQQQQERELLLHELFERSQGTLMTNGSSSYNNMSQLSSYNNHSYTSDALVEQFNASVGSSRLDRSVAEFYLEMCAQDLDTAVGFFKEQQQVQAEVIAASGSVAVGVSAAVTPRPQQPREEPRRFIAQPQPQPQPQQPQEVPVAPRPRSIPRRTRSRDGTLSRRRNLSVDVPEAPTVTAPDVSPDNLHSHDDRAIEETFDRLCQAYNTGVPSSTIPRRCSVAATKVPFRGGQNRRGSVGAPLARSNSERRPSVPIEPTYRRPRRSQSSQTYNSTVVKRVAVKKQQSTSLRDLEFDDYRQTSNTGASVTRPPTAARRRYDGYWERTPPTRAALSPNPLT